MIEYYKNIIEKHIIENIKHCDKLSFEIFSKSVDNYFCDIAKNKEEKQNYNRVYSLEEILEIANDFFDSIGLIELINNTQIEYEFVEKDNHELINKLKKHNINSSVSFRKNGIPYIIIFLEKNLNDAFKIIHETMHGIGGYSESMKEQSLCEVLTILSELYLKDFLLEKNNEEYKINDQHRVRNIEEYLSSASYEKELIKQLNISGKITDFYSSDELIKLFANKLKDRKKLYIHEIEKYLFGMLFASYIHNNFDKSIFIELINEIENMNFSDFLSKLGINNSDEKLDENGYQKIFTSYKKEYLNE